ncbi:MAG: HAD family hydrolase [Rhodobacteraceae bacterium]|nr:HAD family hydrolase [Paracoccaceae bacterium]
MLNGIIFDKDGTLFDFEATWGTWIGEVLQELGAGDPAMIGALADVLGYDLGNQRFFPSSSVIAGTVEEQAKAVAETLDRDVQDLTAELNFMAAAVKQVEVTPLKPLLADLRARGLKLGVATNDAESSALSHLGSVGLTDAFDFIAGYDSGFGGKPAPGQLVAFAKAMGLAPDTVAMVGDSTHDLHAARAAGMKAVGVLTGPADEAVLAPHADIVLPSIADLPRWIAT